VVQRTRYQLDNRGAHPFRRTRVINTVQSRSYSRARFSAISLNSIVIIGEVNVESKLESGDGFGATPVAIFVDGVSILVEEGLEVYQATSD